MDNDTPKNSREDALTPSQPEQAESPLRPPAQLIVSEAAPKNNSLPRFSAGGLRRTCIHLGDTDRAAIQQIKERLELPSSALAVRYALRLLAKRLAQPGILADTQRWKP